jgi:hypothetical protein
LSGGDFLCGRSLLGNAHPVSIHIIHGFYFTETNALGFSVTEITLEIFTVNDIKTHRPEGTDRYARTTANAYVVIHHYPAEFLIPGNGPHGTDDQARGVLTLLAGHRDIKAF